MSNLCHVSNQIATLANVEESYCIKCGATVTEEIINRVTVLACDNNIECGHIHYPEEFNYD